MAMKLNEKGIKPLSRTISDKPKELIVPDFILIKFNGNKKAFNTFESLNTAIKKNMWNG
jgi:hypothetical protein